MAELLFIATTIFVAYVLYKVLGDDKAKPETTADVTANITSHPEQASSVQETAKAEKKPEPVTTESAKPATSSTVTGDTLKNPKTGEVAKVPNSYAFAKRWIKDALVEEGLLDKVYKNNEIDDAVNARIQEALKKLKAMEKYS